MTTLSYSSVTDRIYRSHMVVTTCIKLIIYYINDETVK